MSKKGPKKVLKVSCTATDAINSLGKAAQTFAKTAEDISNIPQAVKDYSGGLPKGKITFMTGYGKAKSHTNQSGEKISRQPFENRKKNKARFNKKKKF